MAEGGGKRVGRKLLVASIGVASVTFGACGQFKAPAADAATEAAAEDARDAGVEQPADAADTADTGAADAGAADAGQDRQIIANLVAFFDDDAGA